MLLEDAVEHTRSRLLIIAPWIKDGVVDAAFVESLERLCRRDVLIHLGYGINKDDREHDSTALGLLRELARRDQRLVLRQLGYTHAKILLWDDKLVVTSFNWLSFKGDRARKYRQEEGTFIGLPAYVDAEYARHRAAIEEA